MNNEEKSPTLYVVEEFHERNTGNQWRHVVASPSLNIAINQARREWPNYDVRIVEYVPKGAYMKPEDIEKKVAGARLCCPFCGMTYTTIEFEWSSEHSEKRAHVECVSCNAKGPGATRSAAGNAEDDPSWDAAEAMVYDLWNHRYHNCESFEQLRIENQKLREELKDLRESLRKILDKELKERMNDDG